MPNFRLFDELENGLRLRLIDRSAVSIVVIADYDNVEDIAEDIAAEEGIGAAHRLHLRLATGGLQWSRHKRVFVMAARQVF